MTSPVLGEMATTPASGTRYFRITFSAARWTMGSSVSSAFRPPGSGAVTLLGRTSSRKRSRPDKSTFCCRAGPGSTLDSAGGRGLSPDRRGQRATQSPKTAPAPSQRDRLMGPLYGEVTDWAKISARSPDDDPNRPREQASTREPSGRLQDNQPGELG